MKKYIILFMAITIALLVSACSSKDNLAVEVTKPLYFQADKASSFAIKVLDNGNPVTGLDISAVLTMKNMDHGEVNITLTEADEGTYLGEAQIPMAGDWEIFLTIGKDDDIIEQLINYEITEPEGVATINGDWISEDDLVFYQFINKLHTAISREVDKANLKGDALDEALKYWESIDKQNEDPNQLLTQIVRLRAMSLLATEKGHTASEEEILAEIEKVRSQYAEYPIAQQMIKEFGEDKFWAIEKTQYEMIVLSQKVQQDLIEQVKKENPDVNEQEIMYLAKKQYEELLVSQVNSLKIEIL